MISGRLVGQHAYNVRTEHELYQFQEQLDYQIRIYRHLYEFSVDDPLLAVILAERDRVICAEGCDKRELLALGQILEMVRYIAFPLGVDPYQPVGLLFAGNTVNSASYRTQIQADSESVVGLANLVSQVATAIRMRREIQAREQRLKQEAHARERIEQELHVARRIQQASLPEVVPALEGWEISPRYRPAREMGGDFFDFIELEDGRLGLVVGDATGKGVPAALVMSATCGMLRADWVALLLSLMLVMFGASSIEEPYMPANGSLSWLGTGVAFLGYALAPAQCCQLQLLGLFG